jgi:tetraacyldisaccharide 4'-kinase
MHEPRFWRQRGAPARLLVPFAVIYGAIAGARMARMGARAGVPVICVGNLTLGGAGKTPAAIALARLLIAQGLTPFFLSRGYGGTRAGPLRVSPQHRAADVGDEPLLLTRVAPTIVARDRAGGAALAVTQGASVVVMDDGFQNPSLAKDFSLVVLDGGRGIDNGFVFPAGPLRAPLATQLKRADALLVIGEPAQTAQRVIASAQARALPVMHGKIAPDPATVADLTGKKALAFAGIAHPGKFFETLAAAGIAAPVTRGFPDHHVFTRAEAHDLLETAKREGLQLLTTEKDLARIQGDANAADLARASIALPVAMTFDQPQKLEQLVTMSVTSKRAAGAEWSHESPRG